MTARETLKQANELELHAVIGMLGPLGIEDAEPVSAPKHYDRQAADEEANAEMQKLLAPAAQGQPATELKEALYSDKYKIAALARNIHEADRFRRDYNIAKATHKQLMLSSYRTLYQRMMKLQSAKEAFNAE